MRWLVVLIIVASLAYTANACNCVNGQCEKHNTCSCRFAFYGETCDTFIFHDINEVFMALRILFIIVSFCLLVVTLTITMDAMRTKAAPYHLVGFGLVCFDCAVQVVLYTSSVETTSGQNYAYVTEVLTVLHFLLIYVTYSVYLLWWIELNQKFKRIKRGMTRITSGTTRPLHLSYMASDSQGSGVAFNETNSSSSSMELQSSTHSLSAGLDESSASVGERDKVADEEAGERKSKEVVVQHIPEVTYTLPKIDSSKSTGSESGGEGGGASPRRRGLSVLWHKVAPRGVSARKVRLILWMACIIVNLSNAARVVMYELNNTEPIAGPIQYMLVSCVAWIIIVLGFDLYKRAFLRKLLLSHKSEATQSIKSVTKTTFIVINVLLVYGVLAVAQSAGGNGESHRYLAITVYVVRAVVTFVTISLFIHCFGGKSVERIVREIGLKLRSCIM